MSDFTANVNANTGYQFRNSEASGWLVYPALNRKVRQSYES